MNMNIPQNIAVDGVRFTLIRHFADMNKSMLMNLNPIPSTIMSIKISENNYSLTGMLVGQLQENHNLQDNTKHKVYYAVGYSREPVTGLTPKSLENMNIYELDSQSLALNVCSSIYSHAKVALEPIVEVTGDPFAHEHQE